MIKYKKEYYEETVSCYVMYAVIFSGSCTK